jgi:hypothetical protein
MKNFANIEEKNKINTKLLRSRKIVSDENQQNTKQNQLKKNINLQNMDEVRKFGKDIKCHLENLKLPNSKNKSILNTQGNQIEKNYEDNEKFKVINSLFFFLKFKF